MPMRLAVEAQQCQITSLRLRYRSAQRESNTYPKLI